ncbi:MAG: PAS domain-containing protein, partial [Actinomycetota bacterium]
VSTGARGRAVYQGVLIDITQQKRSEQRYRRLVEELPVVTYLADGGDDEGHHALPYIAPGIEALTGRTADEWMQRRETWQSMVHPDDLERVRAEDRRTDRTGERFEIEYRLVRDDGRIVWVRDSAVLVERDGAWPVWQGVLEDITARRGADEQLRSAEDRYRSLVERLPATVYIDAVDEVSTALYVSPQYETLTGFTPEERVADPELWVGMLHPDDRERVLAESARTNRTGDPFDAEYRIVTKSGHVLWVHDQAYLVPGQDGGSCWQGVLTDTTERKLSEAALFRRDLILEAVGHAAERFLGATSWTDAIGEVLAHLGQAGGASRAAVYRRETDDRGGAALSLVSEWTAGGVEPLADRIDHGQLSFDEVGLARWAETFANGGIINALTKDLPDSERTTLERGGVRAILALPIVAAGEWWGHLVYDQTQEERVWQQAEVDALRVVANALGAAVGREQAARLLSDAERRYRALVEQIPAITYVDECRDVDEHRVPTVYISPQVETILGYSPEEWQTDTGLWTRLIHPDDRERVTEADRRHYATGEPLAIELRVFAKDGSLRWIRDEAIVLRDDAGRPRWSQGILLDITERKVAEEHLHAAEERYRSLIETVPAATYIDTVDAISSAIYMSPQVEQIFGYRPEEWLADPHLWERGVHPDDLKEVAAKIGRLNREGTPFEAEYRFHRPDGRMVWVHDQAVVLRDEDGVPRMCQGVMFDITERREAEEQLREAEERFRAIVEHVPAAIYLDLPDNSMQTMYVSPQMEQITGITAEEWNGDPDSWASALHPDDREEVLGGYLAAVAAEEPWSGDYRMRTRDGRTIWVHDETTFINDEEGHHAMLLGVLSDITERKVAEQALRDSEQREREAAERLRALDEMKNTFLAAVSHELRSPLTSILGLALTLERSQLPESDRNDLLERLAANARKLDRLLKDLLDIDRLNRGIVEPQYRVTDVGALARRTIESLDALTDRSIMVYADPVVLSVDPAKVERIIENLLMNAARHTTSDRTIWLRVGAEDDGVLIAVEDNGPGVPEELREVIFEPFRQGPTASPHAPGTGIGLSLVARFASLHGGRAWVEERSGGGASFRVFLPAGPVVGSTATVGNGDAGAPTPPTPVERVEAG